MITGMDMLPNWNNPSGPQPVEKSHCTGKGQVEASETDQNSMSKTILPSQWGLPPIEMKECAGGGAYHTPF